MNSSNKNKEEASFILNSPRWYLVETNIHSEKLASFHLRRQKFEVYLPVRAVEKKREAATAPLFPNYVFVGISPDAPRWNEVRTAIGVKAFVGAGGKPCPAPSGLVEGLRLKEVYGVIQLDKKAPRGALPAHRKGDRFKVLDGQFAAFEGLFHEQHDARRVTLLLSIFGRFTKIEFPAADVQALEPPRESQHVP